MVGESASTCPYISSVINVDSPRYAALTHHGHGDCHAPTCSRFACMAGVLSVEPFTAANGVLSKGELSDLLSVSDIFSPNLAEAASMLGRKHELTLDR